MNIRIINFIHANKIIHDLFYEISAPLLLGVYVVFVSFIEGYVLQLLVFTVICVLLEIGASVIFKTKKTWSILTYEVSLIFLLLNLDTLFYFVVAIFAAIVFRYIHERIFPNIKINSAVIGLFVSDIVGGSITWWGASTIPFSYILIAIFIIYTFYHGKFWSAFAFFLLFFILRLSLTANIQFVVTQMGTPGFLLFGLAILQSPGKQGEHFSDNLKRGFLVAFYAIGLPIVGFPLDPLISALLFSEFTLAFLNRSTHNVSKD